MYFACTSRHFCGDGVIWRPPPPLGRVGDADFVLAGLPATTVAFLIAFVIRVAAFRTSTSLVVMQRGRRKNYSLVVYPVYEIAYRDAD